MPFSYKKILIIDDDQLFLKPLIKFLTMNKFQINIANSGIDGIDLQELIRFDLIITDLKMEGMSGIEVINYILSKHPEAKIIVMSGFLNEDQYEELSSKNVVAIFEKPFDYDELLTKVKEAIYGVGQF